MCPYCGNGSGRNGTGITQVPNTDRHRKYHCFKCGNTSDIFQLAKEYYGLTSMCQAFDAVYKHFGLLIESGVSECYEAPCKKEEEKEDEEPIYKDVDFSFYFAECEKKLDPSYLLSRGISEKVQRAYHIGTDLEWVNPRVKERYIQEGKDLSTLVKSPRCIIPTSQFSYLARDTRENISEKQQSYCKQKIGRVRLFNEEMVAKKMDVVFITEGEIDSISVHEATDGQIVSLGLGSLANWRMFLKALEPGDSLADKEYIVLALDNDEAGKEMTEVLKKMIEDMGKKVYIMNYKEKDVNKELVENRGGLLFSIYEAYNKVKNL